MKVFVHFANGFEEIEGLTVVDVLRRAGIDTKMISVTGDLMVTGTHEIAVKTDSLYEDVNYEECDMIVLPGGMPGTTNLAEHQGLTKEILSFNEKNKWLAAICAAPMIFGKLGLLDGKTAVIYPSMEQHLIGAKVGKNNVEVDGNIITSKGPATAMEFAFKLVEILKGTETSNELRKAMLM